MANFQLSSSLPNVPWDVDCRALSSASKAVAVKAGASLWSTSESMEEVNDSE